MAYLRGVETIELVAGPIPVNSVRSAVIGLVGVSPFGPKQALTLCTTQADFAQFGFWHKDNTIATALDAIAKQGSATVMVINVFDDASHSQVSTETVTVARNRARLSDLLIDDLVVEVGATTLVLDTDYSYDATTQTIRILDTVTYPDGTSLDLTYNSVDLSAVAAADIIGGTTGGGVRTGLDLLDIAYSTFGFEPKILVCPQFNESTTVADALTAKAEEYRAVALLDAPSGALPSEVLAGRNGVAGVVKNFFRNSKHAFLLYPQQIVEDPYRTAIAGGQIEATLPYSVFMAGIMAEVDRAEGYWVSPTNRRINGILRPERELTFILNNPSSETNLLNAAGVATVAKASSSGYLTWGDNNAAYPSSTDPDVFVPVRRSANITDESIERAGMAWLGKPINQALIDSIKEQGNAFMRTQIQRGAIVDGEVTYDSADNPPSQIAAGQLVFTVQYIPPPPLTRLTYKRYLNINLLTFQ